MNIKDIYIGLEKKIYKTITKKELKQFIRLTGDTNPIHFNKNYTSKTLLKKPIVHGMLGASFISAVVGNKLPGPGAIWFSQNLEFLSPVRVDDKLCIIAKVIYKDDQFGIIKLNTEIFNQNNIKVLTGEAKVKLTVKNNNQNSNIVKLKKKKKEKKIFIKKNNIKTVIILGASGEIGENVAIAFSKLNYNVCLHYFKNKTKINKLFSILKNKKNKIIKIKANIVSKNSTDLMMEKIYETYGRIDLIINCTSTKIIPIKHRKSKWKDFNSQIETHVKGTFNIINSSYDYFKINNGGKIINILSQYIDSPTNDLHHYVVGKSALSSYIKSVVPELAAHGIIMNSVSPGLTNTDQTANLPEGLKVLSIAKTPLKRLCSKDDIVNAILYLASNKANFLCGETIRINGGQTII